MGLTGFDLSYPLRLCYNPTTIRATARKESGMATPNETSDISKMIRRLALLYRHFSETLERELGPEKARPLIRKAIDAYGAQIGREARERNVDAGIPLSAANYKDDLPSVGWETEPETILGEACTRVTRCPLADELRSIDPALARIYCYVDQAKMQAYNPKLVYIHLKNILDGDDFCRHTVRPKAGADLDG